MQFIPSSLISCVAGATIPPEHRPVEKSRLKSARRTGFMIVASFLGPLRKFSAFPDDDVLLSSPRKPGYTRRTPPAANTNLPFVSSAVTLIAILRRMHAGCDTGLADRASREISSTGRRT